MLTSEELDDGVSSELIQKYSMAGPRYTSYPTVPHWQSGFDDAAYRPVIVAAKNRLSDVSIYIHIPFCNARCLFCGCNVVVRKHHPESADQYLDYLFKEMDGFFSVLGSRVNIRQFHVGGGTPNYLSLVQLKRVIMQVQKYGDFSEDAEVAIEVDPRHCTVEMLGGIRALGFNRISMGIQDFDPKVQKKINRVQSFESVAALIEAGRALNFVSINLDLIYGLPFQTTATFSETIEKIIALSPDRIALYAYAHLPELIKHQREFSPDTLPDAKAKLDLFLNARTQLIEAGYLAIAMDHFSKPKDELAQAYRDKKLYRNFMGYTVRPADDFIGFGVSSIGFFNGTFVQNVKDLPIYYARLDAGLLPSERGKTLTPDDLIRQFVIAKLMCEFSLSKDDLARRFEIEFQDYFSNELLRLAEFERDELIQIQPEGLSVTELGQFFIRNICMVFDAYLGQGAATYSKTL